MRIHSKIHDYDVHFHDTSDFLHDFSRRGERCYVIDANVLRCHGQGCLREIAREPVIELAVSEQGKCLDTVLTLYDRLIERAAKRNLTLISIGGGILQDLSGFAASTLYRGIPWIFVPTTLLAQADSCIGSKTSLNYKRFKNLIGTFYPPAEIFIHIPFLQTLPETDFFSGVGEVVKLHVMGGESSTRAIIGLLPAIARREPAALRTAVEASLGIKQTFLAGDEFDTGRRNMLNFGHCFGHAIESSSDFAIPHGQAVVAGMILAGAVVRRRGLLSEENHAFLTRELFLPSLRVRFRGEYSSRRPLSKG